MRHEGAAVSVLPVPYDATTSWMGGTRNGPEAILAASRQLELFDEELECEPFRVGLETLPPLEPDARGPEFMVEAVRKAVSAELARDRFVLTLGGEHSITVGCVQAYLDKYPRLEVLQLDAHADLRDSYQQSSYSHACTMRRIIDRCRVVGVGIRAWSLEEHVFMKERGIEPFSMKRIHGRHDWIESVVGELGPEVYLTVDMDAFDPSCCPGVGTPEPGGLSWSQVNDLLLALGRRCRIVGADIVECMPIPGQAVTEFLAARLAYRIVGIAFLDKLAKSYDHCS